MDRRELNEYWETVVDTIQEGVMIVNTEGVIIAVNKGLTRLTQFSREELIGRSCLALNCTMCAVVREHKGQHWCSLFRDGSIDMKRCTLKRKDGAYVPVLKNAALLHDRDRQVIGAVETLTDLSEIEKRDQQLEVFRRELRTEDSFQNIIGRSEAMRQVFQLISNAATSDAPVIILGESGTGKELAAQAVHSLSARSEQPLVKVNCAALPESLLESELFGHVKGAFTGAVSGRIGRFEAAHNGSIFLDEIGDISPGTQVKLLRILEEQVIERVGDNSPRPVNTRIITATNSDLASLVDEGRFRKDLYYRIKVIPIHLPSLRERPEDIPLLAEVFFQRIRLKTGKDSIEGLAPDALQLMQDYPWPGNIRELRSAMEFAFVSCHEPLIRASHLQPALDRRSQEPQEGPASQPEESLEERTKKELIQALRQSRGNQTQAARILGISRVTVWNRMKRFGIDPGAMKRG